jgi:uncharacterized membrane protein
MKSTARITGGCHMKFIKWYTPLLVLNPIALYLATLRLPSQVPIHVGPTGMIDGWGSKWMIVGLGLIPFLLLLFQRIYEKQTAQTDTTVANQKAANVLFPTITIFITLITWLPAYLGFQYDQDLSKPLVLPIDLIVLVPLSILFIIIGTYMADLKPNVLIGIRTPWTLSNTYVWEETHRFGGKLSIIGGIFSGVSCLVGYFIHSITVSLVGFMIGILSAALIPVVYSYVIYRRLSK